MDTLNLQPGPNLNTYFIRHTRTLNISDETRSNLFAQHRIAIHYPELADGVLHEEDNESLDPLRHDRKGRNILRRFLQLGDSGGYICAEYYNQNGWIIGRVDPSTPVEHFLGRWRDDPERVAVLKTLRLSSWQQITEGIAAPMLVGRPRQGTLNHWKGARSSIQRLLEGRLAIESFDDLTADQQEVMCSEFLRTRPDRIGLKSPLSMLAVPTGRTMRTVDIYGVCEDGSLIAAQVTHYPWTSPEGQRKAAKLSPYITSCHAILFCDTDRLETKDGVAIVPIRAIFDQYRETEIGRSWIRAMSALDRLKEQPK